MTLNDVEIKKLIHVNFIGELCVQLLHLSEQL